MKKINVLGNFSGRNAGDAAILGCLLHDISERYHDIEFSVPTINPTFIRENYSEYNVRPVSLMPWHGSAKILGLPVFREALKADVILVTDAILFDRQLYNPLFNYLWTLSWVLPRAWKREIPVVLYNCSLGPIRSRAGHACLQRVLDSTAALILRDKASVELLQEQKFQHPRIIEGADCALNVRAAEEARFQQIRREADLFSSQRPVIGFNVNSYVDAFVKSGGGFGRYNLVELYAEVVDRVIDSLEVDVIFVETQHMDLGIAADVLRAIRHKERVRLISNRYYSYRDLCSVIAKMALFVGMRTHSLIFSAAMGVVPVGIVTYPKNRGFMRTIGLEDNLVDFKALVPEAFYNVIIRAYQDRERLRRQMLPVVEMEKEKARRSAEVLKEYLE